MTTTISCWLICHLSSEANINTEHNAIVFLHILDSQCKHIRQPKLEKKEK